MSPRSQYGDSNLKSDEPLDQAPANKKPMAAITTATIRSFLVISVTSTVIFACGSLMLVFPRRRGTRAQGGQTDVVNYRARAHHPTYRD